MDSLLGALVSIGLPAVGFAVAAVVILRAYNSEFKKIATEEEREKAKAEIWRRTLVSLQLPSTPIVFSLVIFIMVSKENLADELFNAICLNVGISGLVVALAEGYLIGASMKSVFDDYSNWGKSIVCLTFCELHVVLSLAIGVLTLQRVDGVVTSLVLANYLIAMASVGSLVSVGLMLQADLGDLKRRLLLGLPGVCISIGGFVLAMYLLGAFGGCAVC